MCRIPSRARLRPRLPVAMGAAATLAAGWIVGPFAAAGTLRWVAPAAAVVAWVVVRTALDDRLLRRRLPGYDAYASRVRFRLVPRVW